MVNNTGAICLIEQKTGVFVAALKLKKARILYSIRYITGHKKREQRLPPPVDDSQRKNPYCELLQIVVQM